MEASDRRAAGQLSVEPAVEPWQDDVTVTFVVFSKWSGFSRQSLVFAKAFPHRVLDADNEVLVEYQCGVVF
jgi:hypothetical protein